MVDLKRNAGNRNWMDDFYRGVVGSVVLTAYNNKTYRIGDIDFGTSPLSTFKQGEKDVSFIEYYQKKYNLTIKDQEQPMLVCMTKARDVRAGKEEKVLLVPELCRATGLTEQHRANFQMMKVSRIHCFHFVRFSSIVCIFRQWLVTPKWIRILARSACSNSLLA